MGEVTVVGSGASGVQFALSLLRKGYSVRMLDVGRAGPEAVLPDRDLNGLKRELEDPAAYFLGAGYEGVTWPDSEGEFYGFPPGKRYIFQPVEAEGIQTSGFEPLVSHARGGLAQAWTAGVYPFDDRDLEQFPFGYADLEPYYAEVARRIGVTGAEDDLARFLPVHDGLAEPVELDPHSSELLRAYARQRGRLNSRLGCYLGRSRLATLSRARDGRSACDRLGRCLWGCPLGALYTPDMTLEECRGYSSFRYQDGVVVERFEFEEELSDRAAVLGARRVTCVALRDARRGTRFRQPVQTLALAAGALSSSRIFLESVSRRGEAPPVLTGLMDNRQVLVPFVNLRRVGRPYEPRSYQYHQLSLGIEMDPARPYVHGQITTLNTAQPHPILQTVPLDFRSSIYVFRNLRGALGLVNLNFHDWRRPECRLMLRKESGREGERALAIQYAAPPEAKAWIRQALRRTRRMLRRLGCVVPPRSIHVRPMGASVHYAGTLPMSAEKRPGTVTPLCRSHEFENLYLVDGATFPFLPAKNITFTLMANAIRVADHAF